jgi:dienelactone hydrolase
MTRRDLLQEFGIAIAASEALCGAPARAGETLDGTQPLTLDGDLAEKLMDGAHEFVARQIARSVTGRAKYWKRDFSSAEAYRKSVEPNRQRFLRMIGAVDARSAGQIEYYGDDRNPALVAETDSYTIQQVRWPVLEGVWGVGLLLRPKHPASAFVIALGDADQTPEEMCGLAPGVPKENQFARTLMASGCEVLLPVLIDRTARWSGHPEIKMTDQPHREWIYRQAYHMGRHIIGYEVQKVLAAVDWFARAHTAQANKIGVAGYCEGGLIAFFAAAADPRIDAAFVSGYFDSRQHIWSEPIYRNLFGILREFGDAEIATLIAPSPLIIEYSRIPDITSPRGDLKTPSFESVKAEYDRIAELSKDGFQITKLISGPGGAPAGPGSSEALADFAGALGIQSLKHDGGALPTDRRESFDSGERQKRQVRELENHVQKLIRSSERVREQFYLYKAAPELADEAWSMRLRHSTHNPEKFIEASKWYRRYFHEEVLGKFDEPLLAPNPRTRKIYDREKWTGYEVVLDVFPELFAWGILLLPKDLKPGERRPVVVCQHGRRGVPQEVIEGNVEAYRDFAARLCEQGFITFAPHNLYRGEDRYRWLCRKANGVKATLFSFILAQHEQILRWLATLPMVDAGRIAFYGLSYGGETAVRVPTILEGYSLSICSGDFNTWNEKVAATDQRFSFMYTIEWEMPYFNMGNTFDYAEMAYLMLPRPFMVERGHNDRVGRDSWVAYQYAKVRWLYAQYNLAEKTEIEFFNGGHTINGQGTFRFLHKQLNWPGKA